MDPFVVFGVRRQAMEQLYPRQPRSTGANRGDPYGSVPLESMS